ncbi:MAG TPA: multicopper oxidase family protein [Longimicrobium sp.]|nr:multicopper oxidase family protein [Longimicrobium sp.]
MRSSILHAAVMAAACAAFIAPSRVQAQDEPPSPPRDLGAPYNAPAEVRTGAGGVFRAAITASDGGLLGGGRTMPTVVYNGRINADVLRMDPGDSLDIVVRNALRPDSANYKFVSWTNFHYHGFNVSPMPPADNVTFIRIGRDSSFHYQFRLPQSISPGLYWYHPHPHGISQMQVQRGMSGPISVGNVLEKVGYSSYIPERFLMFRDFSYVGTNSPTASCWGPSNVPYPLMNGQPLTHMTMEAGGTQFWRIANVGSDRVFNLKVRNTRGGRMQFRVIARDGNAVAEQYVTDSIYLVPGNRWEVLVKGPILPTDTLELYSEAVRRDAGCVMPRVTFAWITSFRFLRSPAAPVALTMLGSPEQADTIRMLREAVTVHRDTMNFTQNPDSFFINKVTYNPNRIDKTIAIGEVQEWDLNNDSNDLHAFHIHQGDFLVVAERDSGSTAWRPVTRKERLDTVFMPRGGGVRVRFVYTDPRLAGLFVYHCHMLFHEDRGMMQNLCLYDPDPNKGPASAQCANPSGGGHGMMH